MKTPLAFNRDLLYTYSAAKKIVTTTARSSDHISLYMCSATIQIVITKAWSFDNILLYTYKAARRLQ